MTIIFFIFYNLFCFAKEKIMNETYWTKTLLGVYNYLDNIAGAIDKITLKTALNSFEYSKANMYKNNVYNISNKLIDLAERKITLINLKLLVDDVLKNIPIKDAVFLINRYFDRLKCKDLAEKYNISMRTVFRKLTSAELSFEHRLKVKGYNDLTLNDMLKNESWILNYYNQIKNKKEEDFNISTSSLERVVSL